MEGVGVVCVCVSVCVCMCLCEKEIWGRGVYFSVCVCVCQSCSWWHKGLWLRDVTPPVSVLVWPRTGMTGPSAPLTDNAPHSSALSPLLSSPLLFSRSAEHTSELHSH